jgi:HEAT repeat protein
MKDETLFTRILESLSTKSETPPTSELSPLSDLDQSQFSRFEPVWNTLNNNQRQKLLSSLGILAEEQIEYQFDRIYQLALSDSDAEVRRLAIENLWESQDQKLIPVYLDAMASDPSNDVKISAIQALGRFVLLGQFGKIDSDKLTMIEDELLTLVSQDVILEIQRSCIESLGYSSRPGVEDIINAAHLSKDEKLRQSALTAMGRSANDRWGEVILQELNSPSPNLRSAAARATGELETRSAVGYLIELLEDVNDNVRDHAIWSLGQIGGTLAREALETFQASIEGMDASDQIDEALEHIAFLEGTPDFLLLADDDEEDELA